jgi:hypothetical protein
MLDLEITLIKAFGWSLKDIDEADFEHLLRIYWRLTSHPQEEHRVFCDQVDWLRPGIE